jgi:hypothetical protein
LKGRGFEPRRQEHYILQRALAPEVQRSSNKPGMEIRPARVVFIDLPARVKVYKGEKEIISIWLPLLVPIQTMAGVRTFPQDK